jgi:hypothetical protein
MVDGISAGGRYFDEGLKVIHELTILEANACARVEYKVEEWSESWA